MSKGSKERADTRYVAIERTNLRTGRKTLQSVLDPDCKRAKRQARKKTHGKKGNRGLAARDICAK